METSNFEMKKERPGRDKAKVQKCNNPPCDYESRDKKTEHICPNCGWLTSGT